MISGLVAIVRSATPETSKPTQAIQGRMIMLSDSELLGFSQTSSPIAWSGKRRSATAIACGRRSARLPTTSPTIASREWCSLESMTTVRVRTCGLRMSC